MRAPLRSTLGPLLATLLGACAGSHRSTTSAPHGVPATVTAATLDDARRALDERPLGDAALRGVRTQVTRLLAADAHAALQSGDTARAILRLQAALVHYTPEELAQGSLPRELEAPARALLTVSSPRGEEGHALGALRVLLALESPPADARPTWDRIREWGRRNREDFQRPWVREGELADVDREIAALIPARDVLDEAAAHIAARREAAAAARSQRNEQTRLSFDEGRAIGVGLQRSPADMAVLFLRVGALDEASRRLSSMGPNAQNTGLATVITGIAHGEGGADALGALARQLAPIDRLAAAGVCRVGRLRYATDARFPLCLAQVAHADHDLGLASAHLEVAAALRPDDAEALNDAIVEAARWLGSEVGADEVEPGRRAWERAHTLLARWRTRTPDRAPPVAEADLEEAAAQLELAAGNLPEATGHLERASQATPASRDALYLLAEVAWRQGDAAGATRRLDEALALPLRPTESDSTFRPRYAVRRAQVLEAAGRADEARALYAETLPSLDALVNIARGRELGEVQLQRATALAGAGRAGDVRAALDAAVDAAPDSRDIAGHAIMFCVGHARWSDALDLSRRARAQLTLEPAWQVYFALWSQLAARAGHLPDDAGAAAFLTSVAATDDPHVSWTTRLAQRAVGRIERDALLGAARTTGQRAEAMFYDAMAELAANDAAAATRDLREVVASHALHYFEYDMAWETLRRLGATTR